LWFRMERPGFISVVPHRMLGHLLFWKCCTGTLNPPVPLPAAILEAPKGSRTTSIYGDEDDFLFPFIQKMGKQTLQPEMILRRHIRPALKPLGLTKRISWHSVQHPLANLLRQNGVDVKVAQELLRHANSRITLEIYQQSVTEERRAAQALVFNGLLRGSNPQHPKTP